MDFLFVFIVGLIISIFELAFIYVASPKKFELKIIDNTIIAIIYKNYFFLPFTTKIKRYKDIKEACIKSRIEKNKYSSYTVYDLVLNFQKKSIILFKSNKDREELEEHCKKINQSIVSFEECFISEPTITSKKTAILIVLFFSPLLIFIPPKHSRNSYITDITQNFYIYLVTTGILATFMILSLIINLFINAKNSKDITLLTDYNKKENVDIDSEAKRINDSIIK